MSITEAIKRARELDEQATSGPWIADSRNSRFKLPCEKKKGDGWHSVEIDTCDGRSTPSCEFIATTRNAWKAAVDVIAAAEGLRRLQQSECAVYPELMGAYQKGLDNALTAFAEAMGEKP